ncbi:hypothetical protein P3G55_17705 [Leptospira sp. 96542]|nr:hypothetical protein [Leptospira sp. 96542]
MNKIFLILLTIVSINCLSFRSGEHENAEIVNKLDAPPKAIIKINLKYDYRVDGAKQGDINPQLVDAWLKTAEETLKESSEVTVSREDILANYFFEMTVREETNSFSTTVSPFISGLTLGLIPSYTKSDITVNTIVKDKKGNVLGEVTKKESLKMVGQILIVFVNVFVKPLDTIIAQRKDLLRASYLEIKQNNIFKGSKK